MSEESANNEIDIISGDDARIILDKAVLERLGENWDDEIGEWSVVTGHDFMMRVTNGKITIDFTVDLLGEITITEKESMATENAGRLVAYFFLGTSLFIAILVAHLAGYI